jgi:hypothetical protein
MAKVSNFFFTLSSSHHIKYVKSHMFGVLNIDKKLITQFRYLLRHESFELS